jgi:hypothetical protein
VRELQPLALVWHYGRIDDRMVQLLGHRNLRATQAGAAASSDRNKKRAHLKETGTLPMAIDPPSLISYTTQFAANAMQQIVNLISAQQLLPTNQHKLSSCSSRITRKKQTENRHAIDEEHEVSTIKTTTTTTTA